MNKSILKVILVAIPLLAFVPAMAQMDNAFQSTSTMTGSGSAYASNPTLSSDGMATYSAAVRRSPGTPGQGSQDNKEIEDPSPIGSALPVLLLLAGAYTGVVALRRRQQA